MNSKVDTALMEILAILSDKENEFTACEMLGILGGASHVVASRMIPPPAQKTQEG